MASFKTLADVKNNDPRRPGNNLSTYAGGERSGLAIDLPPPPESNKLELYSDGFVVAGQFRPFSDPANKELWETIEKGHVPVEFQNQFEASKEGEVILSTADRRDISYKDRGSKSQHKHSSKPLSPEKPKAPPIKTPGCQIAAKPTSSPGVVSVDASRSTLQIDRSQPLVNLAFRFSNGSRLNQEFNESHTTQDVYNYVRQVAPSSQPYQLVAGFPPQQITGKTLKELDNELITQRPSP